MAGFGEKLREARERHGFTIEHVEEETKIRKLYLNALEEENFSLLPPQVYANGFVKRYARFLDLDEEELSNEFKELAYGNIPIDAPEPILPKPQKESLLNKIPVKNIITAAIFLIIVIWAGNYLVGYISDLVNDQNPARPPVVDKNKPDKQNPAPVQPAADQLKMTVKVKPDQKCWVLVRVDGEEKLSQTLTGNQEQSFIAKDSIFIRVGNAGAVDLLINDKPIKPIGKAAEVKEKEFKYGVKY